MGKIKTALTLILKDRKLFKSFFVQYFSFLWSDKRYLELLFHINQGYLLDLNNPQTFSEKIQWLKLYYRKPSFTIMVDKYKAKEYVADIVGEKYIIPTLGVWKKPELIEWDKLPNQFVLKTTHGGGGECSVYVCKDKNSLDKNKVVRDLKKSLKQDIYGKLREWPYKNVTKQIIAEELLKDETRNGDIHDYKFFCFNGEPTYCQVIRGRSSFMTIDFFDMNWNHMPFHEPRNYPFSQNVIDCPENFPEMVEVAKKLSNGIPFIRVDLYNIDGVIYFGELTFFPTSGLGGFDPNYWDKVFGDMITLPEKTNS